METVAGIFDSRGEAEQAVRRIHSLGIPNDRIALLTPNMSDSEIEKRVPTTETEEPGEGKAMGGAVGGAMGIAGGAALGAAAASLIVPGVGPVIAGGLLGAAILGAGGTVTGMAAGEAVDEALVEGLPHDELYLYEHAVRQGRSVVIAFTEDEGSAQRVREVFADMRAETIDAAKENWWLELRAAEEANYRQQGRNFQNDEGSYRRGFEAAQNVKMRGRSFAEVQSELEEVFTKCDEAFRRGYERGVVYCRSLRETHKS
jgi:hypothetical protein